MRADLAIWDVAHPAELAYRIGFNPLPSASSAASAETADPGRVTLARARGGLARRPRVRSTRRARPAIEAAAARVAAAARGGAPVYGVNTGFGKLASVTIAAGGHRHAAAQPDPVALLAASATRRRRRSSG